MRNRHNRSPTNIEKHSTLEKLAQVSESLKEKIMCSKQDQMLKHLQDFETFERSESGTGDSLVTIESLRHINDHVL